MFKTERIFISSQRCETVKSRNELHNECLGYFFNYVNGVICLSTLKTSAMKSVSAIKLHTN